MEKFIPDVLKAVYIDGDGLPSLRFDHGDIAVYIPMKPNQRIIKNSFYLIETVKYNMEIGGDQKEVDVVKVMEVYNETIHLFTPSAEGRIYRKESDLKFIGRVVVYLHTFNKNKA